MRSSETLVIPAVRRAKFVRRAVFAVILLMLAGEAVLSILLLGSLGTYAFLLVVGWYALRALLDLDHLPFRACDQLRQVELDSRDRCPQLWDAVEKQVAKLDMPRPKVWMFAFVDCFAASWNCFQEKAIAINVMVLARMDPALVETMIGHELAHIKNRDQPDTNVLQNVTFAVAYAGLILYVIAAVSFLFSADISLIIVAGVCASLSVLAFLSMTRVFKRLLWLQEYAADALGAYVTGNPAAAALALIMLEQQAKIVIAALRAQGFEVNDDDLNSDHPPTAERVRRLLLPH